jgi:uncharacterized protein with HEPN domain
MPPDDRDAAYLRDMLDAARTICQFATGVSSDEYLVDRKQRDAVRRHEAEAFKRTHAAGGVAG